MNVYYIDGQSLTLDGIRTIINDQEAMVALSEEAAKNCRVTRAQIERWMEKDAPVVYGVNTGLGNLKDVVVPPEKHIEWNKTLPYPHAAGMGDYLPPEVTLMSLLLRANVLARAYSGVRPELIDRILAVYNAKVAPAVHGEGSTGLSDLGPLAQNVMTVAGLDGAKATLEREPVQKVDLTSGGGKKEGSESGGSGEGSSGKQVIIQKLLIPVDLKKIKDLEQLLAMLKEVEDYAEANGSEEPVDDQDADPAPA